MAVAGIGNPDNFFDLLKCSGLRVEKELVYPDHYQFSKEEVENILKQADNENLNIVMTEKDYFKIKHYKIRDIGVFAVSLEINDRVNFIKSIQEVYDKKINYLIQSLLFTFFLVGRLVGIEFSRKIFSNLFLFIGPYFKSSKILNKNIENFSHNISHEEKNKNNRKYVEKLWNDFY